MDLIQKALIKAYELHSSQKRKGNGAPYFVHLLDTCKYLMYETSDVDIICAGILHDTLEDTNYLESDLKTDFNERIYNLVKFCTEPKVLNELNGIEEDKQITWKHRKLNAISKLSIASDDELLVFCADKVSTLLSIREDLICGVDIWSKLNGSKPDVEWYYVEIAKALEPRLKNKRIFLLYTDLIKVFRETTHTS